MEEIERGVGRKLERKVQEFVKHIETTGKYANKSPADWAAEFLRDTAREPWLTHDDGPIFAKHNRKYRELKTGHTTIGQIYTINERGSYKRISTREMGMNAFQAAVWAIREVQNKRQANMDRHNYGPATKSEDEAVMEFLRIKDEVMKEWKKADERMEEGEGSQNPDELEADFAAICQREVKWIRMEIQENLRKREDEEDENMREWWEAKDKIWEEEEYSSDRSIPSEIGTPASWEASVDHTQIIDLEYEDEEVRNTREESIETTIGYDTRLSASSPPPESSTESSGGTDYGTQPEAMDYDHFFGTVGDEPIEEYYQDIGMDWETAACEMADAVVERLEKEKRTNNYVRDAIRDSIRGTKRDFSKFANLSGQTEEKPKIRKMATPKGNENKRRAVEKMITGLMSSKWASQTEMDKRKEEAEKRIEEIKKEVEEEYIQEQRVREKEEREERAEARRAEKEEESMREYMGKNCTRDGMFKWMKHMEYLVQGQAERIRELEEEVERQRVSLRFGVTAVRFRVEGLVRICHDW